MTTHKHIQKVSTLAFALALMVSASVASAQPCADAFEALYPEGADQQIRHILNEPDGEISYGLEAEFNLKKAPGVLNWYRPASIPDAEWKAMSLEEKQSKINGSGRGMVKTDDAPEWLLDELSSDPGGAELITKPTNSLETALKWVNQVEKTAGGTGKGRSKAFYWQGNVAYKNQGNYSQVARDGIDGYVRVTADLAQFGKLVRGYKHHQQKKSFIPGKNLNHFVLGPMNTKHAEAIGQELDAAARGENLNGHSHYMQGSYFRTWAYGTGRFGIEARDPHKEVNVLKQEFRRMTHAMQKGFKSYEKFKAVKVLDETGDFGKFSQPVQSMLANIKYKKPDGSTGSVYKGRYALPMRDFEGFYPKALGLKGEAATSFKNKVTKARDEYVRTLESIASNTNLDNFAKRDQVHIAIAKFANDSGVYQAIDKYMSGIAK